ncbi:hypothetical protein [Streptomyces sp. NPDC002690]
MVCVAILSAGVTVGAVQARNETASAASDDSEGDLANEADEAVQGCADSWNERNPNKGSVASIATAAQQTADATAYVNVGFSEIFPDRCMITVANPSTLYAQQYLQESGNEWSMIPAWTGMVSQIPSSVRQWNARMAQSGVIIVM